jgi:hypothetical protein
MVVALKFAYELLFIVCEVMKFLRLEILAHYIMTQTDTITIISTVVRLIFVPVACDIGVY